MAKVHQIDNTKIRVNGRDHLPWHFHVENGSDAVLVTIETLEVFAGQLAARFLSPALAWASENKAMLIAEWDRCNPQYPYRGQ